MTRQEARFRMIAYGSVGCLFVAYVVVRQTTAEPERPAHAAVEAGVTAVSPQSQVLGVAPVDGVAERGFHFTEGQGEMRRRWTNGEAQLEIPVQSGASPTSLLVSIEATGPNSEVTIDVDGTTVFSGSIVPPWERSFPIPPNPSRHMLVLDIKSPSWVPAAVQSGSTDTRRLGVRVRSIQVL